MELKKAATYEEQVKLLKDKNIIVCLGTSYLSFQRKQKNVFFQPILSESVVFIILTQN